MSTEQFNTSEAFKSSDDKGFVRSVSVIFEIPDKGYLLCSEMRKGFPNPEIRTHEDHMIGGKVDMTDLSCLEAGFREFCEETGYRSEGYEIKGSVKMMIKKFKKCPTVKWDYCVSPKKGMYNRFYVIRLNNCPDFDFFSHFTDYIAGWEKGENTALESLFFWNKDEPFDRKTTNLLQTFVSNLPVDKDFR